MGYIGNAPYQGLVTGDNVLDGSITAQDLAPGAAVPSQTGNAGKYLTTDGTNASWGALSQVRVTAIDYPGDDTATLPAGGATLTLTGTGFAATPMVFVDGTLAPSVSFVSSTQITFVAPAKSAGTYHLYVVNPDGATAIFVNGISYSGVPTWTTAAGSLGTYDGTFSIQLQATSDSAVTYALATGSSLPAGVTLSSGGLISGTIASEQTFSFSVDAIDAENQETSRSFSVTISLAEPYFNYTTLLLPGNGTNGAQNNTFLDSSSNAFSITRNGNTTQGTFSPFSQTGWSNYFNASTNYLAASGAGLSVGSSNFMWEGWFNFNSPSENAVRVMMVNYTTGFTTGSIFFGKHNNYSGKVAVWVYNYSTGGALLVEPDLPPAGWVHYALVRNGSSWSIFRNGVQTVTATYSGVGSTNTAMYIGGTGESAAFSLGGYISNARVVVGSAVYTSNFTPSTTPLTAITNTQLLTCQSNRFRDASTNNFTITRNGDVSVQAFSPFNPTAAWSAATNGGSGYFDGSGDYLNTTSTQVIPSGSFTVEAWVYLTTTSAGVTVVAQGSSGNAARFSLGIESSLWWAQIGSATINAGTPVTNTWTHLAVTFNGSTLTLYVNGTSVGTASTSTNAQNTTLRIGSLGPADWAAYYWPGYIGQVRISNTVRSISVPTALYTADANTTFLANFTNAGIYDATSKNDLETVGNAQISTAQSKFGGSSMYFDGTGDWLVLPPNPPNNLTPFGTGDFTVEFWVRFSSFYNYISIVSSTRGANGFNCGSQAAAQIVWYANGAERVRGTTTLSANTWYHIAFVRYSGTLKGYVNGVQEGTTYADSINYSTPIIRVGDLDTGGEAFTGYLQDLRITKGLARYTANFTPPTTAHKLR